RPRRDGPVIIGDSAVELALCMIDRRALQEGERRLRIELQRLVEIGEGAIEIAFGSIGAAPIDVGRELIALSFPTSTGNDLRATGDPRVEVAAATPRPVIALGKSRRTEQNANECGKGETDE